DVLAHITVQRLPRCRVSFSPTPAVASPQKKLPFHRLEEGRGVNDCVRRETSGKITYSSRPSENERVQGPAQSILQLYQTREVASSTLFVTEPRLEFHRDAMSIRLALQNAKPALPVLRRRGVDV